MVEFLNTYWPLLIVAIMIGAIAGMMFLRPHQRVTFDHEAAPQRPHMTPAAKAAAGTIAEPGHHLSDDIAAAASDAVGSIIGANPHAGQAAAGASDDFTRLKGVGPRLAALLADRGLTRFAQLASLSAGQVETIDAGLGGFKGRLARDRVIEQADYLARGDVYGYEQRFGKL